MKPVSSVSHRNTKDNNLCKTRAQRTFLHERQRQHRPCDFEKNSSPNRGHRISTECPPRLGGPRVVHTLPRYAAVSNLALVFVELFRSGHASGRSQLEPPVVVGLICVEEHREPEEKNIAATEGDNTNSVQLPDLLWYIYSGENILQVAPCGGWHNITMNRFEIGVRMVSGVHRCFTRNETVAMHTTAGIPRCVDDQGRPSSHPRPIRLRSIPTARVAVCSEADAVLVAGILSFFKRQKRG